MNAPQPSLDSIFCTAIEIPAPEERAEYIARVCGDNQGMREQVERLVAAHFCAADFLDSPAEPHPAGARLETHEYQTLPEPTTASTAPQVGAMVAGRYKLLEAIGDGGMGTVWLAEQTEPVRRKVALKLIKPGMDSRQVLARFEAERQALALMDHPNIAKVLDAGTTPDGRPFFAMELVKGVPITKFCDEHRLTPQQRLALFVPVCQAVQHAHQKGVIHRDIKPNNVMVAKYDDRPVPKVIDFGVAKATGQQLTEQTLNTAFGSVVGTVEYMSPEQASFNQLDVDTRSDIYSLGVLLYELLTGSPPFGKQELANAGLLEMLRVIREKEPAKPSTKLSSSDALPTLSANRGIEPKRLTRLLRGELDWIVMKALEKDRSRRYETANGLSMDIQRFLADEPVEACPPTTGYRFRKFIRRNRGAVIAGTTMVFLLMAGIVGTTIGLFRARAAEGDALWQRDRKDAALQNESQARLSERQALQSETLARRQTRQALNTVTDEVLDDLLGRQPQLTEKHREFLKNLLKFHAEFAAAKADDPDGRESRAEGYYRVGRIRKTLGQIQEAEVALREAVAIQRNLVQEFANRAERRQALVRYCLYLGEVMGENGPVLPVQPNKEIIEVYREALAHARRVVGLSQKPEYRRDLGKAAYNLGTFLYYDRRADEAEPLIRESLAIDKQLQEEFGKTDDYANSLAIGHEQLARVLFTQGRKTEALEANRTAIVYSRHVAARLRGKPDQREELAKTCLSLGVHLNGMREMDEAEQTFKEGVALGKQLAAEYPLRTQIRVVLALTQNNLGKLLFDRGKLPEAETAWHDSVALYQKLAVELRTQPEMRVHLSFNHHNLGIVLMRRDRKREGEEQWRAGLEVSRELVKEFSDRPDYHFDLGFHCEEMAGQLREEGHRPDAVEMWREAVKHYEKAGRLGNAALVRFNMGVTLASMDRLDEAIAEFRVLTQIDKPNPAGHFHLAHALQSKGEYQEALAEYRETLRLKKDFSNAAAELRETERLAALEKRLPGIIAGKEKAKDAAEMLGFAEVCQSKAHKQYMAAVDFFRVAFAGHAKLAESRERWDRYNAACAAALVARGEDKSVTNIDDAGRGRLRQQALDWLTADLKSWHQFLDKEQEKAALVADILTHWLEDSDFAEVRGEKALALLPAKEQKSWKELWDDVAALRKRATEMTVKKVPDKK